MMANSPADILVELEDAVATCPLDRCARILEGILQLLTGSRDRPQELLASVVDGVLLRLTERVEASALIQLGAALAELKVAPPKTLQRLALHDNPGVACPVLLKSQALSTSDLETIAISSGEPQQLAIAVRARIEPRLTETLIKRGGRSVHLALISNAGARFSDAAYVALVETCASDDELTKALALRPGTPDPVLRKLLPASPAPDARAEPKASTVSCPRAAAPIVPKLPSAAAYASARPEIVALNRIGKLHDRRRLRGPGAAAVAQGWQAWVCQFSRDARQAITRLSFAERERAQHVFETLLLSTSQWTVRWGEIAASVKESSRRDRGAKTGGSR
ncbi:hypothetical protein ABIF96_006244 [Bradyrhizobium ottawaense]|uniref:DUF2336 domain-containing protein n=1 Tax=Bradyrhizobium ottawaense TaxID=931866 RepID=UPI00383489D2